jgi:hypothetical protein
MVIVLSVRRFTASGCSFGIFKRFLATATKQLKTLRKYDISNL